MKNIIKLLLLALVTIIFMSGCAQKVRIKALQPAEVGVMASKKKIAVSDFKNDTVGLSGKIESSIAKHKLDNKRYFTILSRKDMARVIAEQKLQSSELMDETTTTRVGKLIGAQAIINGEIALANAERGSYREEREKCLEYSKKKGCTKYRYYTVVCKTTQATVSANINIVNIETGLIIYGDTLSREYSGDSCQSYNQILSKHQALNRLATSIANSFVYKLTPNYTYFNVELLDSIELNSVTSAQEKKFEGALKYIEVARYDKAKRMLETLMEQLDGKSYVVAYVYGVVNEATGDYRVAQKLYYQADDLVDEPVDEISAAIKRIQRLIDKRDEAKQQMESA